MTEQAPAHLLVIDRDQRLRDLLRQYLKTQGFLVSVARDEAHAIRLLQGLEFDLVMIDAQMRDARALRASLDVPVLCLSKKGAATPSGVTVITKPFEPQALCNTINEILHREPSAPLRSLRKVRLGSLSFDPESGRAMRAGAPVPLTATEVQLMRIFSSQPGATIGRGDLASRLGREELREKARAIDVQITRLRRKIEDDPKNPRFLQTVRGVGYVLVPSGSY